MTDPTMSQSTKPTAPSVEVPGSLLTEENLQKAARCLYARLSDWNSITKDWTFEFSSKEQSQLWGATNTMRKVMTDIEVVRTVGEKLHLIPKDVVRHHEEFRRARLSLSAALEASDVAPADTRGVLRKLQEWKGCKCTWHRASDEGEFDPFSLAPEARPSAFLKTHEVLRPETDTANTAIKPSEPMDFGNTISFAGQGSLAEMIGREVGKAIGGSSQRSTERMTQDGCMRLNQYRMARLDQDKVYEHSREHYREGKDLTTLYEASRYRARKTVETGTELESMHGKLTKLAKGHDDMLRSRLGRGIGELEESGFGSKAPRSLIWLVFDWGLDRLAKNMINRLKTSNTSSPEHLESALSPPPSAPAWNKVGGKASNLPRGPNAAARYNSAQSAHRTSRNYSSGGPSSSRPTLTDAQKREQGTMPDPESSPAFTIKSVKHKKQKKQTGGGSGVQE